MKLNALILNSFALDSKGGNPAGLILNADELNHEQKLALAGKVGVSETAFVSKSKVADFKLDFYTPTKQIPHCGHATVATFAYLRQLKQVTSPKSSKETVDGTREIFFEGSRAYMQQMAPSFHRVSEEEAEKIALALNIEVGQLSTRPEVVNTGNSFLMVQVEESLLKEIKPNLELISEFSAPYDLIGFYVFSLTNRKDFDATARMFGPYYGIPEESATGMAAGPLACFLDKYFFSGRTEYNILQGEYMPEPSPSHLHIRLEKKSEKITSLYAGGEAYLANELTLEI